MPWTLGVNSEKFWLWRLTLLKCWVKHRFYTFTLHCWLCPRLLICVASTTVHLTCTYNKITSVFPLSERQLILRAIMFSFSTQQGCLSIRELMSNKGHSSPCQSVTTPGPVRSFLPAPSSSGPHVTVGPRHCMYQRTPVWLVWDMTTLLCCHWWLLTHPTEWILLS